MGDVMPSTLQVAEAWLKGITELGSRVATTLPADLSTWSASGFVTVAGPVGGDPHMYLPIEQPVVSIHCWAVSEQSDKPPWGIAHDLATFMRFSDYGFLDHENVGRYLLPTPTARYRGARVNNAFMVSSPSRVPDDPFGYAHVVVNAEFHWVAP